MAQPPPGHVLDTQVDRAKTDLVPGGGLYDTGRVAVTAVWYTLLTSTEQLSGMAWPQTDGFIEATRRLVCDNVFVDAGIGAAGLEAIRRSNPYLGIGVGITSIALSEFCREEYDDSVHGEKDPGFTGGQCAFQYNVTIQYRRVNGQMASTFSVVWGPIGGFRIDGDANTTGAYIQILSKGIGGSPQANQTWDYPSQGNAGGFQGMGAATILSKTIVPRFGEADNCGNPPTQPPNIVPGPFKPFNYTDNDINVPGPNNTTINKPTNFSLGGFRIDKLFEGPLVEVDVGGIKVDVDFESDPPEAKGPSVDELADQLDELQTGLDQLDEELKGIKECVCSGEEIETETVTLALSSCPSDTDPVREFRNFEVVKDTVDSETIADFDRSADLAIAGCISSRLPEPVAPRVIGQGISRLESLVFWSELLGPEVSSVILKLEDLDPAHRNIYKLAGEQSESKYGHLGWTPSGFESNSSGPFCWTLSTYYQLPIGHGNGRVRVSLKPDLRWTLYDSGERLDIVQINARR